jgi:hypothetical protein
MSISDETVKRVAERAGFAHQQSAVREILIAAGLDRIQSELHGAHEEIRRTQQRLGVKIVEVEDAKREARILRASLQGIQRTTNHSEAKRMAKQALSKTEPWIELDPKEKA